MPVAAAAGWAGVTDDPHRREVRSMLSRMVCRAGRWLSGIALQIGCAGEHVLIRTNLVRTMCWLAVVGYAGVNYHVQVAWSEMASSVESVCAGELHNDAVNVAVCRARTSRLREMHCSWLVGGGTQGDVSETDRL